VLSSSAETPICALIWRKIDHASRAVHRCVQSGSAPAAASPLRCSRDWFHGRRCSRDLREGEAHGLSPGSAADLLAHAGARPGGADALGSLRFRPSASQEPLPGATLDVAELDHCALSLGKRSIASARVAWSPGEQALVRPCRASGPSAPPSRMRVGRTPRLRRALVIGCSAESGTDRRSPTARVRANFATMPRIRTEVLRPSKRSMPCSTAAQRLARRLRCGLRPDEPESKPHQTLMKPPLPDPGRRAFVARRGAPRRGRNLRYSMASRSGAGIGHPLGTGVCQGRRRLHAPVGNDPAGPVPSGEAHARQMRMT